MDQSRLLLTGRQSSHFTRCARFYAEELGLPYQYHPVFELMSLDPSDYQGNPALKMPTLLVDGQPLYGAVNICRELVRLAGEERGFVWPEDLSSFELVNAQELTLQAMATEVTLILSKMTGARPENTHLEKARNSLRNSLDWLESRLPGLLDELPQDRRLSLLEVTLFCLIEHLQFREVLSVTPYPRLLAFAEQFSGRPGARATIFQLDVKPGY